MHAGTRSQRWGRGLLSRGDALNRTSLKANVVFNVLGMVVPIGIALVTVPIYISYIGTARYGVLSIIWILLGYFGFLDFGLSRASANALAKLAHASGKERADVLMTSLYLNLLLGISGSILLYYAGGAILHHVLPLSETLSTEVQRSFPWIACMLPLALLAGVARGAIESRELFFVVNVLDLIGIILGQIIPIICAIVVGPTLAVVIPAAFLARALSVGLNLLYVAKIERLNRVRVFDQSRLRELLGFGAWVSITSFISPLLTSIDQLLVGSTLGAAAVAHYAVPMNIVGRSQIVAAPLARALYPRFSRLAPREALVLAEKAVISLGYSFGAICGPAIIIGGPFMSFWMGTDFAAYATPVFELLLLGAWINGIAFIPYSFLEGQGRPDLVAKLHALELLPFIIALWALLHRFGLYGAAMAWSGRVAVDATLLLKIARFSGTRLFRLFPALILILASYAVTQMAQVSFLRSLLFAGLIFLAFAGCAIAFDATTRQILLTLVGGPEEATD
jgi:O-antigen/teichoic acid export membrane protein